MIRSILFLLIVILGSSIIGCESRVLPSRGLIIDLEAAGVDNHDVTTSIIDFLQINKFSLVNTKDGYEELSRSSTLLEYKDGEETRISIDLNNAQEVYVRMNVRTKQWNEEADVLFEKLVTALEVHWPNAVRKEPAPEVQ